MYLRGMAQADPSAPWCTQCYMSTQLFPGDAGYVDTEDVCDIASTAYNPTICQAGPPSNPITTPAGGTIPSSSGGINWGSTISSIISSFGPVINSATGLYTANRLTSPAAIQAASTGSSILLLGGLALGAYLLMGRRGK